MQGLEIRLVHGITALDREQWDRLVGADGSPFLEWDWLDSLEASGCAVPGTGWAPHHLTVRHGPDLVAAVPLYLKSHSQGEFVFDHGWAEAATRAGMTYYPKLLVGVPFTPVAGRRLLTHPAVDRPALLRVLAAALRDLCDANELSSVHVNFCAPDELDPLREAGFLYRQGVQYHWHNRGYRCFDDYLADLRSKRRNQVRRERREVAASGLTIEVHEGDAIPEAWFPPMYEIYRRTVEKFPWGNLYLNRAFFMDLSRRFRRNLCFLTARRGERLVAGAFTVQKGGVLYGRYWGALEEVRHLHFELCYYQGIEHCIARRYRRFEPGAGGDFKYFRGFDPTPTHSLHYLRHPGLATAVARFLDRERAHVREAVEELTARSPIRKS